MPMYSYKCKLCGTTIDLIRTFEQRDAPSKCQAAFERTPEETSSAVCSGELERDEMPLTARMHYGWGQVS